MNPEDIKPNIVKIAIIISLLLILTSCSNKEMGDFNWGTGPGDRHKKTIINEVFEDCHYFHDL